MAGTLSGGNQQKLCLARAVAMQPQVLFVSEPTRGVDIGARETILKILLDLNENHGTTVVMASSELDEMRQVCDRIAVIYEGRVAGTFSPQDSDLTYALAFSGMKCEERYYA
jgi:simple sugar transport system ATP-binding protein